MKNVLIVDDEKLLRWSLTTELKEMGFNVFSQELAEEGHKIAREQTLDLCILDIRLPDYSGIELLRKVKALQPDAYVIMITAFAEVETAVEALKLGAYDYLIKPFNLEKMKHVIRKALETNELKKEVNFLKQKEHSRFQQEKMLGDHPSMVKVMDFITKLASVPISTVLITGESGTGKGLVSRAIHYTGTRQNRSFVEINCSAISETLLESELFGHEKGAFTNAISQKKGLFEVADGGTIFLDEIGEMSMSIQSKLLKIIEDKSFKHVGGVKDISVDVQIIAATNKDLEKEIQAGKFREDLFFRLNVIPIQVPPLRERIDDITVLTAHFITHYNSVFAKQVKGLSPEAETLMKSYRWPGNIRELKNVIERAILLESSDYILPDHLHLNISGPGSKKSISAGANGNGRPTVAADLFTAELEVPRNGVDLEALIAAIEKKIITRALTMTSQNQSQTAKLLNLNRDTLRYKMKKLEILQPSQAGAQPDPANGDAPQENGKA